MVYYTLFYYVLFIFLVSCLALCKASPITVDPDTTSLIDEYGRTRIFHGINVVIKVPPFIPITDHFVRGDSLAQEDLDNFEEWGLNVVRLGVMWPGVEPVRNQYNMTYLNIAKGIIANMSEHGIYTLIDCHQDVFSEKFCGEGVPMWAAQPVNSSLDAFPLPLKLPYPTVNGVPSVEDCNEIFWADYLMTFAASSAYQRLYDNYDGLLDSFMAYWKEIASTFASFDSVIGYELLNEPWAGDVFLRPDLLYPTVADKENLAPMYNQLNTAIREVDSEHIIFFEPVTWDDLKVGFETVPGGNDYKNRSVLSYHIYMPPDISVDAALDVRNKDIKRLGCAGFLTEFDLHQNLSGIDYTTVQADRYQQSWMGWAFAELYNEDGSVFTAMVATLSRTYPMAVAGNLNEFTYANETKQFFLNFVADVSISQPTDIYLNEKLSYPTGYEVQINPSSTFWNSSHNHVYIWNTNLPPNTNVTVTIYPTTLSM